jgi:hypothetical protein
MKLLFTKSGAPLSLLIRWGLKQDCSHFVVEFEKLGLVFHSNLLGVHIQWANHFLESATIVHSLTFPMGIEEESTLFSSMAELTEGSPYDFTAFAYFMWRGLLWRIFKVPFPKKNPWAEKGDFLCTEIAEILPLSIRPADEDFGMISPELLFNQLSNLHPEANPK